ncbi:MAG TPA: ATP-grasp domain-containing protein [Pirellulales bacterium]|nr:ATP-grasp domain-containing protein [Pirellulales bacterium]
MSLDVAILFNQPSLPVDHPDYAQEAGVLESVVAIEGALAAAGHRSRRIPVGNDPRAVVDQIRSTAAPDVVFNLFEGFHGRGTGEGAVTGLLDLAGWPYTGSPADCLALVRDKVRTKWLLAGAGLPTPESRPLDARGLSQAEYAALLTNGPWIVKPAREDASLGIDRHSVVETPAAFAERVEQIATKFGDVLAERFIAGREFNVSVVALPEAKTLSLAEIEFAPEVAGGWGIVTYEGKWSPESVDCVGTPVRCPADVEPDLARRIETVALGAFEVTGCRDYARIDLRVDHRGAIYIIEVNGNPDLDPGAGFARALRAAGIEYNRFIVDLVRQAAHRRT